MSDSFRRVRAMYQQPGLVEQQRACTERTARTARTREQGVCIVGVHAGRLPVRPFQLVRNAEQAASRETLLRNADAVATCRIVAVDEVEKALFPVDHDRAWNDGGAVEHHL